MTTTRAKMIKTTHLTTPHLTTKTNSDTHLTTKRQRNPHPTTKDKKKRLIAWLISMRLL